MYPNNIAGLAQESPEQMLINKNNSDETELKTKTIKLKKKFKKKIIKKDGKEEQIKNL